MVFCSVGGRRVGGSWASLLPNVQICGELQQSVALTFEPVDPRMFPGSELSSDSSGEPQQTLQSGNATHFASFPFGSYLWNSTFHAAEGRTGIDQFIECNWEVFVNSWNTQKISLSND